jgi:hypothetical protein
VGLNGRIKRLEGQTSDGGAFDYEARRARTEALRARVRARIERVLEQCRDNGDPEPTPEQADAAYKQLRDTLRRRAGLE